MLASDGDGDLTMCGLSGLLAIDKRVCSRNGAKIDRQIDKLSSSCFAAPKSLLFNLSLSYEGTVEFL